MNNVNDMVKELMNKEIIIDVSKCKYRDEYTNFCLAEKDDIGETYTICTATDCYYKQLAHKTQECEQYKQALEEVYGIIARLLITKDVKYLSKEINEILNIISKAKDNNE